MTRPWFAPQSMSNTGASGDAAPSRSTFHHHGFSSCAARWLGTMSRSTPRPRCVQRAGERVEGGAAAELATDAGRVHDVVAVGRTRYRFEDR